MATRRKILISTQVATEWKWKEDDPAMIVAEAVRLHVAMINECKGVPGVLEERWREAHTVRHCALSLVGEPIMYPRINELIGELHARKISSFLVTNAQFPDAIRTLRPVTQLYVSVDAPNKDDLEEVDSCVEIKFTASTPSTRHLLDGVAMSVPHRSTEPARPRHRREMTS